MINEGKKSRGQEGKLVNPSPLPSPTRGEGVTCHPELVSGSHKITSLQTLSRICKFAYCSLTNSTLSQRERVCSKTAFTLAEVLITLGIIGIVAAMTLPTVINKINNKHLEVAFKKIYSELSQVVQKIAADNGGTLEGVLEDNSSQSVQRLLMKYMKHVKICERNPSTPHNCFASYSYRDGSKVGSTEWGDTMILPSGAILTINCVNSNCESRTELKYPIGCFRLRVDTNGLKRPNVLGKDVFDFYVTKDRLIPRGAPETTLDGSSSDWARAYYVLQHGID